jgi:hypothetical protein
MQQNGKLWADLGERAAWTLIQGGLAGEAVTLFDLSPWLALPIMGALSGLKSWLASQVGNGTAATLPQSAERF